MYQPALTDAERTLWTTRLTQAEIAKHNLATGKAVEQFVDQNGEQVRYTKATLQTLTAYITEIENKLNPALARYNRPRPLGFLF